MAKLLILDAPDGVGKTTAIKEAINTLNSTNPNSAVSFASLGGTEFSKKMREFVLQNGEYLDKSYLSFMYLMLASMEDVFMNGVIPALKEGKNVIVDRGWISTMVYQLFRHKETHQCNLAAIKDFSDKIMDKIFKIDSFSNSKFLYLTLIPQEDDIPEFVKRLDHRLEQPKNFYDPQDIKEYAVMVEDYYAACIEFKSHRNKFSFAPHIFRYVKSATTIEQNVNTILDFFIGAA